MKVDHLTPPLPTSNSSVEPSTSSLGQNSYRRKVSSFSNTGTPNTSVMSLELTIISTLLFFEDRTNMVTRNKTKTK